MRKQLRQMSWTAVLLLPILALSAVTIGVGVADANASIDKEDRKDLKHFSKALIAWYEVNQAGQPRTDADLKQISKLLKRVANECSKVSDATLAKIDRRMQSQWRENLQAGALQYEKGIVAHYKAVKRGEEPSADARSWMRAGQQKMVRFHRYYNANIERIARDLKRNGVDLFG